MSCYFRQNSDTDIAIPKYVESSGVTYYTIKVRVAQVEWLVERRYKDFDELNEKLVEEIAISKKLLPPKKVNRNMHLFTNINIVFLSFSRLDRRQ